MAEQGEAPAPEYKATITGSREDALQLLSDLIESEEAREQLQNRSTVRELLLGYGIDIPEEAIPEQIELPPTRHLEEALRALTSDDPDYSLFGALPPFAPPPFSGGGVVFWVIFVQLAKQGPPAA